MPVLVAPGQFSAKSAAKFATEVMADTPWGFWKMEEAAGATSLLDASGNGRHLSTIAGSPTFAQVGPDGSTTDGIAWPSASTNNATGTAATTTADTSFTIEAWVFFAAGPTAQHTLFTLSNGTTNYFDLSLLTGPVVRVTVRGSASGGSFQSSANLALSTWHHVVGVFDKPATGAQLHLRYNKTNTTFGNNAIVNNPTCTPKVHTGPFTGGAAVTVGPCAYYQTALSDARIDAHYDAMR